MEQDLGQGEGFGYWGRRMIEVEGLTKYYGDFPALRDVTFRVEEGEILGFLGPNEAGKTTAMRIQWRRGRGSAT